MALRKLEPDEKELMKDGITELYLGLSELLKDDMQMYSYDWNQIFMGIKNLQKLCNGCIERNNDLSKEKI